MVLIKTTEEYRVENEQEATDLIEQFKNGQLAGNYEVVKSGYTLKTKKSKGEIVEAWYIVNITKSFNYED